MSANLFRSWIKNLGTKLLGNRGRRSRRLGSGEAERSATGIHPRLEMLEDRVVPANTWQVNTNADTNIGSGMTGTLRYDLSNYVAGDTINIQSGIGTITLTSALPTIAKNLTITGQGTGNSVISGGATAYATTNFQVLNIASGVTASISSLTIENGYVATAGGGINNAGTLILQNSTVSSNRANGSGGGIYSTGSLSLTNDTITGNTVGASFSAHNGGGVYIFGGTLTMQDCAVTGNSVNTSSYGAGLDAQYNTVITVSDSTFSGNSAHYGSGIYTYEAASVTLNFDTIAYNTLSTNGYCGGLYTSSGSSTTTVYLVDSIVTNNTGADAVGTITLANSSLIGTTGSGLTVGTNSASTIGVTSAGLATTLAVNNGGPTATIALLPSSSAIGAGVSISGITTDQRGFSRPTTAGTIDIGAYQLQSVTGTTTNYLPANSTSLTISGFAFDPTVANDTVTFNNGVSGTVTTATSTTLTVNITAGLSSLTAGTAINATGVTVDTNGTGVIAVQVATVIPVVTPSSATLASSATTLTIAGVGFDTTSTHDTVTFSNSGLTGSVTHATSNYLTISLTGLSNLTAGTALNASVTVDSESSGNPVEVALLVASGPTVTSSTTTNLAANAATLIITGTGFDSIATNDTVTFNDGVTGSVTTSNSSNMTVSLTGLTTVTVGSPLNASVTVDGNSSGTAVQVATVVPGVNSSSTTTITENSSTVTITGGGFSSTASNDTVTFGTLGAAGTVSSASATQLIVGFTSPPTALGSLTASVSVGSYSSGTAVQVATVVPTVTSSSATLADSSATIILTGTGFSSTASNVTITFGTLGVTGTVTSASPTQLTVTVTSPPTALGSLTASVSVSGFSSGTAVQVATEINGLWTVISTSGSAGSFTAQTMPYDIIHTLAGDTINFQSGLGTVTVGSVMTVNHALTIIGNGATSTLISGGGTTEIFSVASGVTASIASLTIENGNAEGSGGGIANQGSLTLSNATVSDNYASHGGGIANSGTLMLTNVTVSGNAVYSDAGGIINRGTLTMSGGAVSGNSAATGGGISNAGTLTLSDVSVTGNTGGEGEGIINTGSLTALDNTTISDNSGGSFGGGVFNSGSLTLTNVTVSDNVTGIGGGIDNATGGAATLSTVTISGNFASSTGGGISNAGTLTISNSTITANTAGSKGGGISNTGHLTLLNSMVSSNKAFSGAGIYTTGSMTLANDTIMSNSTGTTFGTRYGGGIYMIGGTLTMQDCTVSGNSLTGYGGGIANGGTNTSGGVLTVSDSTISGNNSKYGGGIFVAASGTATLNFDTIAYNVVSSYGAGVYASSGFGYATVNLVDSIVANNTGSSDTVGTITQANSSLIGNTGGSNTTFTGSTSTDLLNVTAGLATTLATNNGGPTATIALLPSSPAIGEGLASVTGITTDQRGIALASPPDIGAFQLDTVTTNTANLLPTATTLTITGSAFDPNSANDTVTFSPTNVTGTVTAANSTSLTVSLTGLSALTADTNLMATVSVDGVTGPTSQVATVVFPPTVTASSASLATNASTITIGGTNFLAPASDSVTFNLGATGSVTAATTTSLTVTLTTDPTTSGSLTAIVTVAGVGNSGSAVQVATVVPSLSVTSNTNNLPNYSPTITIAGSGFSPTAANDTVTFDDGATGSVTAASTTSLTVTFSTPQPLAGELDAVVTVTGAGSSASTQVATITAPTVNTSTASLPNNMSTLTIHGFFGNNSAGADSVTFNLGAVGNVTSANVGEIFVTFSTQPTATGALTAVVTVTGDGDATTQVATVTAPTVTASTAGLAINAGTITIAGTGFSTTTTSDSVVFSDGATGSVTAATASSLTVSLSTEPTALGSLSAVVTSTGVGVSSSVQVATVVPVVTSSSAGLLAYDTSMTIAGYGFDTNTTQDRVTFGSGVTGTVTGATSTSLTVSLSGLSNVANETALTASVTVDGVSSGSAQEVALVQTSFGVNSVTTTPSGVVLTFNGPINVATTVLYSSPGDTSLGAADVTVVGATSGLLRGSLVIDATNPDMATFVQTSGLLTPDTYTVTVTNEVDAVGGFELGGNVNSTLTVASSSVPVLSVPSFARGPGQSVALSNSVGIPVSISNATGVTQATFSLTYDPTLLTIAPTGALATSTGLTNITYSLTSEDGDHTLLTVSLSGGTGLTASTAEQLLTITASVPTTAPYLNKSVLNLGSVMVNGATAQGVSGVEVAAYLGDVADQGAPSALGAALVNEVGSGAGTGFSKFKDLDPAIIGAVSGDADVSATDASLINQAGSGASIAQIPSVPAGITVTFGGPDPYLYLSAVQGSAGQTVTETLYLDVTNPNGIQLAALDEAIGFDASVLQISDVRGAAGLLGLASYGTVSNVDNGSGVLLVGQAFAGSGLPPVLPFGTNVPVLQFDVTLNANTSLGTVTGMTLLQDGTINSQTKYTAVSDNEGALTWTPGMAPSNSGNAAIDGSVTVIAPTAPLATTTTKQVVASPPVVVRPKVVQPVKRVIPVTPVPSVVANRPVDNTLVAEPIVTLVSPTVDEVATMGPTVVDAATSLVPLPSTVASAQPGITVAGVVATIGPVELASVASAAPSLTKAGDPGSSLSLVAQGMNKAVPTGSTGTPGVKTSTSVLDDVYRLFGTLPGVPSVNGYNLGVTSDGTDEELSAVWDLESLLIGQDLGRTSEDLVSD